MRMLFVMLLVLLSTPAIGREIEQPPFVTIGGRVIHDIRYNELKKVIDSARIFEGCFRYPNDGTIEARDFFKKGDQVLDYFEPLQWEENSDCPRDGWVRFIFTAKENLRDIRKEDVAAECPSPKTMQVEKIVTVEAPPKDEPKPPRIALWSDSILSGFVFTPDIDNAPKEEPVNVSRDAGGDELEMEPISALLNASFPKRVPVPRVRPKKAGPRLPELAN